MITVNAAQQAAIEAGRYKHFARFTLDSSHTLTIGEDKIWQNGFKIDQAVSGRSKFELGACIVNEFKLNIYNPNGLYQNTDFLDKPVYAYIELYDANDTVIGTISKGHYVVDEADTNGQIVKLTCLDMMTVLDRPYSDVSTVFPATLYNIANGIATTCGLTLVLDGSTWLPSGISSNYTVTSRPEEDMTCRDMLSAVCQATGNYATIDRLGQLSITRYDAAFLSETGSTYTGYDYHDINTSKLYSLSRDEAQVTLTGVSVEVGDTAYNAGTDDYMLHIKDNPVINAGSEQTFATALNTLINGWNFRPFEASCRSNMLIEAGDNAVLTDTLGNKYKSVITHMEYSAGNKQKVDCSAESASANSSTRYSPAAQAASKAVKVYDSTVNNYIDLVTKGYGMYRSLITDPDDPPAQIYAFHDAESFAGSTFCMFENGNGIQVGRRDTTSDPWVYTSADVEDAVVLAQTLVANTAIIDALFSRDVTVTGALHSDDYVGASPGASPPYSQAGMGLDFGEKEFEAEHFAIDADGRMWASEGHIGKWQIVDDCLFSEAQLAFTAEEKAELETYYHEWYPSWVCGDTYGVRMRLYPPEAYPSDVPINISPVILVEKQAYHDASHGEGRAPRLEWFECFYVDTNGKMWATEGRCELKFSSYEINAYTYTSPKTPAGLGGVPADNNFVAEGSTGCPSFRARRVTNYGVGDVALGIGSGGVNHGIYSVTLGRWILWGDASDAWFHGRVRTQDAAGYDHDVYGNPQHRRTTNTDTWNIKNNAGTSKFSVNYETGEVTMGTPLAISQGGTGATTRLAAFKNITNQNVGSSAQYFVTLTQNWASAGYSSKADVLTALNIKCPALWSGGLSTVNQQITFTWGGYNAYIIGGTAGGNYYTTVIIPANDLRTSQAKYLLSDEAVWVGFGIWYSGSTGYVKLLAKSGNGSIAHVWGIN